MSLTRKVLAGVFTLAICAAMTVGTTQALVGQQTAEEWGCNGLTGQIDWCPPYTNATCDEYCFNTYETFGECIVEVGGDCCVCAL